MNKLFLLLFSLLPTAVHAEHKYQPSPTNSNHNHNPASSQDEQAIQNSLKMLQNPQMVEHMRLMMQDPNVKDRMKKMMKNLKDNPNAPPHIQQMANADLDKVFERMETALKDPTMLEKLRAMSANESFQTKIKSMASDPAFRAAADEYIGDTVTDMKAGAEEAYTGLASDDDLDSGFTHEDELIDEELE